VQNCTNWPAVIGFPAEMCVMPGDDSNANWGKHVGLGLEMAVGVGLGYFVGAWLDKKYGWAPNGALVGSLLGLAGGMYLLIKHAVRMNADPPKRTGSPATKNEDESTGSQDRGRG
jgi:F0F1-type ATP synthase assembly protein I